jgi:hypothetical protein
VTLAIAAHRASAAACESLPRWFPASGLSIRPASGPPGDAAVRPEVESRSRLCTRQESTASAITGSNNIPSAKKSEARPSASVAAKQSAAYQAITLRCGVRSSREATAGNPRCPGCPGCPGYPGCPGDAEDARAREASFERLAFLIDPVMSHLQEGMLNMAQ